jgi:hypothetical protein
LHARELSDVDGSASEKEREKRRLSWQYHSSDKISMINNLIFM